jgi:hypothetical protein
MNLRSTVIIYADLLQHADTLQNFVHESSSLVTGFHQILLGCDDNFRCDMIEGKTH